MPKHALRTALTAGSLLLLSACGKGIEGTYGSDAQNGAQLHFKSDGTVAISSHGFSEAGYKYKVDDDTITISNPGGIGPTLDLKFDNDGCITGPMIMGKACKS